MLSYRFRSVAVKLAVTVILIVIVALALFYSGMLTNILPQELLFGS